MIQPTQEARYNLELTNSEAKILKAIVGKISGGGPGRKFIDDLYDALIDIPSMGNDGLRFSGNFNHNIEMK